MDFASGSLDKVRSISQRNLAILWNKARGKRQFPRFSEFAPTSRQHDPQQLIIWQVVRAEGAYSFEALFQGRFVEQAVQKSWAGKSLEVIAPSSLRAWSKDCLIECATSGCILYSRLTTSDERNDRVECERLLLPFGKTEVTQIVSSLQLVSTQSQVNRRNAADRLTKASTVSLAIKLEWVQ